MAFTISFNTRFLELKLPAKNLEISELNLVSLVKKKLKILVQKILSQVFSTL